VSAGVPLRKCGNPGRSGCASSSYNFGFGLDEYLA
jgi:hypothetical protein